MRTPVPPTAPLASSVAWAVALIVDDGGRGAASVLLMGSGLLLMGATAVVGMVVAGARWARRLAFAAIGAAVLTAATRPVDLLWRLALVFTALAAAAMFSPSVTSEVRRSPAAAGPPERAVVVSLVLLSAPFALGATSPEASWAELTAALSALVVAFAYTRVAPGGLFALRYLWPALAVGLAPPMGLPAGAVSAVLGTTVFSLGIGKSVKTAFHPLLESGAAFPAPARPASGEPPGGDERPR